MAGKVNQIRKQGSHTIRTRRFRQAGVQLATFGSGRLADAHWMPEAILLNQSMVMGTFKLSSPTHKDSQTKATPTRTPTALQQPRYERLETPFNDRFGNAPLSRHAASPPVFCL